MATFIENVRTKINRTIDNRICLGVTGLSQSGKSTFITSLINQLRQHDAKNARLGKFTAANNHKIHHVKLHPLEDSGLPLFDYSSAINGLASENPVWPTSTSDISGVLIEIVLKDGKDLFRRDAYRSVYIEIRDYPGEWLVDLPMLDMSYLQWSNFIKSQLSKAPRAGMDGNPLTDLSNINPLDSANHEEINRLRSKYVSFLEECKTASPPLSLLQPGRFLLPGQFAGDKILSFIPLTTCDQLDEEVLKKAHKESYFKVLEAKFEKYKKECIKTFYDDFISPVNRQVVLVDVLNVLNGGPDYLNDMIEALDMISASFRYRKRFLSSNVDQVHYVATKVDHTFIRDHDSISDLLAVIVKKSLENIRDHKVKYKVNAVASVRASIEDIDAKTASPVIKANSETGEVIKYAPPRIPDHIPQGSEWDAFSGWHWPKLNPIENSRLTSDQAIQHIRMDYVIENLIGDLCD